MDLNSGKTTKRKALYGAAVAALILTVVALIGAVFSAVCLRLGFEAALMSAVCVAAVIAGAAAFILAIVALITGIAKHSAGTWVCGLVCMVISAGSVLFCLLRLVGGLFYDMPIL